MKSFLVVLICAINSFKVSFVISQDPCNEYKTIAGEFKRSSDYTLNISVDLAYSDDRLTRGWYRILNDAGDTMPTSAPGAFKCGTWFPIWLNGNPTVNLGHNISVPVCLQTFSNACGRSWDIQIKNCTNGYLVYYLIPSPLTDSAYCFGNTSPCPSGTFSETGYSPGCSSNFPSDVFVPEVTVNTSIGNVYNSFFKDYNTEPIFNCSFPDPGKEFYYDINWFINENEVKKEEKVLFENLNTTILRPRHWEAVYDMNMIVKCSVRARHSESTVPGPHHYSANFLAGIVPEKYLYEVNEGESVNVTFRATIPLGCIADQYDVLKTCYQTIKVSYPNGSSCRYGEIVSSLRPIVQGQCGADIYSNSWHAHHTLIVHGNIDNLYNKESVRYAALRLSLARSFKDESKAWAIVNIPDIKIKINDKDPSLVGTTCSSYTDPNYNTFDSHYYSAQISGEYVLYRHKREPYWVHTLSSACAWGTCNVGIAIRSHDSLFVVRTVDECRNPIRFSGTDHDYTATITSRTYPMIDFRDCDDRNMKIYRNGKEFTVTLPSGTEIFFRIKFDTWGGSSDLLVVNNINIKPSLLDIGQTEGLCGTLNFNRNDEFEERYTTTIVDQDEFVKSWSISNSSDESLFGSSLRFTNDLFYYTPYCVCGSTAIGNNPIGSAIDVHCNLTQPLEQCYEKTTNLDQFLYSSCSGRQRRDTRYLRDTHESDEVFDMSALKYSPDFQENYIPPPAEWKFEWTEELARETCIHAFGNVTALETCKEYANLNTDEYIAPCMTDIKETGGTALLEGTILTMFSLCLTEVSRNETLLVTPSNSSSNGTSDEESSEIAFLTLSDYIKNQLCRNNCSQNGMCNTGTCVCDDGFIGDDCSESRTSPPVHVTIPSGGKCGTRSRNCEKTNVYGRFESIDVWCNLVYFQVVNNVKQSAASPVIEKAEYISFSAVSCPLTLHSSRRKRRSITDKSAEGYDIRVSNDGTNFGDEATILIYDEECYSCNVTSVTCTILISCPLLTTTESPTVSGSMDTKKTSTEENSIDILTTTTTPPQSAAFETTTLVIEPSKDSKDLIPIICGIVAGIFFLMLVALIAYCKCKPEKATHGNAEPYVTKVPQKGTFRMETSSAETLDIEWTERRPRTPEQLFIATAFK